MADNTKMPVNIAVAFMDPLKRPATAALLNSYFSRRQIAGLPPRLTGEDIENLTNLLHWHTPPDTDTVKLLESVIAAGTAPQMPNVATAPPPPPAEPGHPDDPDRAAAGDFPEPEPYSSSPFLAAARRGDIR